MSLTTEHGYGYCSKWSLYGSRYLSEKRKKNDAKDVIDLGGCYQPGSLSGREIIGQHLQFFSFVKSMTENVFSLVHEQNQV